VPPSNGSKASPEIQPPNAVSGLSKLRNGTFETSRLLCSRRLVQ
jgi:hypothetical protein